MALSLQLGYPDVPRSVTNPNVEINNALDVGNPMPFLTFIKTISVSFEPDSLQKYYDFYLKEWNNKNNVKESKNSETIVERYRDFIKEISLNYTTHEEKRFLSKIDFNDPLDLDVVLGFYSKKLNELASYYNKKRNDIKFNTVRNKLKGTNFGTEKTLSELTLSYLKNFEDGKILYDYDAIKNNLEIEIEELYDSYPLYFDQEPDSSIYDKKDLDYGYDIFLKSNSELINEIFNGLSEDLKNLKEVDDLFDNKRSLTEKYISTDFYYLSTGNTTSEIISGKLFSSKNPTNNFVNRFFPTTTSTQKTEYLESPREKGFFKPSKLSIVLVDGKNSSYSINLSNLEPNSLYYFPDPLISGKNGEVLTFVVDDFFLKKNFSSGNAVNQPTSKQFDTKYNGYVSKTEQSEWKYLDRVFDSGFVKDIKSDIYSNLFGLFKNDHRFKKTIKNIDSTITYNLLINGYKFYDDFYNESLLFDYSIEDTSTFLQTSRSGISAWGGNFLTNNNPELTLFFGYYTPYNELIEPSESNLVTTYEILEGGYITKDDYSLYDESISSDLSAFETDSGSFFYSDLIEGGINSISPLQRALNDPLYPSLSANLTIAPRSSSVEIVDGGYTNLIYNFDLSFDSTPFETLPDTINPSIYTLSSYPYVDNYWLNGKLLVRNSANRSVTPLLEQLDHFFSIFPTTVTDQISSNVIRFEIANDVLIIETLNYLTISKIVYESGSFKDPKISSTTINHSLGDFDKISNRFKIGNDFYYCVLDTVSDNISSNNFVIYPKIYKFDLVNYKNTLLFPKSEDLITEFFNISGGDVRYLKCEPPTLTYSSRNNIFNISFLLKDQNNYPKLESYDFFLNPDVVFSKHKSTDFSLTAESTILSSVSTLTFYLSSTEPSTTLEELII